MSNADVIAELTAAFGLKREADLAALLELRSPGTLSYWKSTGRIPWHRYFQIQRLAREKDVTLPASFLVQGEQAA